MLAAAATAMLAGGSKPTKDQRIASMRVRPASHFHNSCSFVVHCNPDPPDHSLCLASTTSRVAEQLAANNCARINGACDGVCVCVCVCACVRVRVRVCV
jgi:hypothetical protein